MTGILVGATCKLCTHHNMVLASIGRCNELVYLRLWI